ncbi:hypothetical protein C427_1837 [Paraglaciecola psychrophila 170]|uniref:Uncharacterized protein n=1 Tax=Paraglaciecola psychrophila 170 TaxID=1129794 RepID=K7A4Q7_9ALTE|nr:hypothetical protein C427_1837 [Paraglaciecola psychrophila 170]GAC37347.1 hypothetical protein GPSY_1718 [Paraglaciecola psychrophila 170]
MNNFKFSLLSAFAFIKNVSDITKLNKPPKLLLMMLKLPAAMMPSQ